MAREVVVNGRFLRRRMTGVERYGIEILRHIGGRLRVEQPHETMAGALGHAWEQFILPAKVGPGSVLWSPANSGPLTVRNQVLTIHDLSPLEHPEWFRPAFAAWYRLSLPILARRVQRILTPSEYVRQKVMAHFNLKQARVVAIPEGVDLLAFRPQAGLPAGAYNLPRRYILFVGSIEPRKNLGGLLRAWDEVRDEFADLSLVIAGGTGRVFRRVALPHSAARVRFLGHVPEAHLPGLYAGAVLFVLPSLEEGFGLGVLEAMACGSPVLTSDGGALPEVVGDAGLIFNLASPSALAQALRQYLNDDGLRSSLRDKGLRRAASFPWERTAENIWKILQDEC
jgi:glycosyltransferase involved in cell wall biosynthesis